jgi:hypothetical protein
MLISTALFMRLSENTFASCGTAKFSQFRALPFGLAIVPLVFTNFFQVVSAHLQTLSIQIHSYLDDSLVKELNSDILLSHTQIVIDLLLELGFLYSWKNSEVIPPQDFVFLREHCRTDLGLVFPPEEKCLALRQFILTFLAKTSVTARQLSQLLGLLNSLADVVQLGRLHIRPLQFYLLEHWTPSSQDWEASIPILEVLSPYLSWWMQRENVMAGFPLASAVPSLTLFTDISLLGWGAYLEGQTVSGDAVFHPSERSHQSFENEGSSVSSFSFQTLSGVPIYCLGNRQHNSGSQPEESGRNTLLLSVSAGQRCSDHILSIPDSSG